LRPDWPGQAATIWSSRGLSLRSISIDSMSWSWRDRCPVRQMERRGPRSGRAGPRTRHPARARAARVVFRWGLQRDRSSPATSINGEPWACHSLTSQCWCSIEATNNVLRVAADASRPSSTHHLSDLSSRGMQRRAWHLVRRRQIALEPGNLKNARVPSARSRRFLHRSTFTTAVCSRWREAVVHSLNYAFR